MKADLHSAIARFQAGDDSKRLFSDFIRLIDEDCYEANYFVGMIYEDGTNGVTKSLDHAYFYYEKSVETIGYVEGYLALARMNYHGLGVPQDFDNAFKYYSLVQQRHGSLIADFMLGRMYHYGQGVGADYREARLLYQSSIKKGSVFGMINMSKLEKDQGRLISCLKWRLKAGWRAARIASDDKSDIRLRGG